MTFRGPAFLTPEVVGDDPAAIVTGRTVRLGLFAFLYDVLAVPYQFRGFESSYPKALVAIGSEK